MQKNLFPKEEKKVYRKLDFKKCIQQNLMKHKLRNIYKNTYKITSIKIGIKKNI